MRFGTTRRHRPHRVCPRCGPNSGATLSAAMLKRQVQALVPAVLLGMPVQCVRAGCPGATTTPTACSRCRAPRAKRRESHCRFASRPEAHIPADAFTIGTVWWGVAGGAVHLASCRSSTCRKSSEPRFSSWDNPFESCARNAPREGPSRHRRGHEAVPRQPPHRFLASSGRW
jgi:hypothetical protein